MRYKILSTSLLILNLNLFAQVKELENFRKEVTMFVNYDNGKIDSLPKTSSNTTRLKENMEAAFLTFIKHKSSKDLEDLKRNSINNRTDYIIGNNNYFFADLRRDPARKELKNNVNYSISFYGLYDYRLPNFVSFYIQPFTVDGKEYIVYYYKLNGAGTYYIKGAENNAIVYKGEAFTSAAAILSFSRVEKDHFLLVEDMGNHGQRAIVLQSAPAGWKSINAFAGKAFVNSTGDYSKLMNKAPRTYLRFAESRTIVSMYGSRFLSKYEIQFDEVSKTISYRQYRQNENEVVMVHAKWENKLFKIDDYYIGTHLNDEEIPMPMGLHRSE
ncbi:MAG: hypothetical protein JNM19_06170 [Chitinophagaceae bacterium]|nr:hypothetical protein [Chitinophagaceae bacterium]